MKNSTNELPLVTVMLVVRNEQRNVCRVLRQILDQDYPKERVEVIVLDGKSDDGTAEIASSFAKEGNTIRVISLSEHGRSQALNYGIRMAAGDVVARVDARTSIERDYISRCVTTLKQTGADNVGGVQCPIWNSRRQEAFGMAQSHPFGVGDAQFRLGRKSGFVDSVYLGCFRKEIFQKVGLFDETAAVISEDSDINQRIRNAGGKVYLDKDIKAFYYPRETFKELWRLYYRYGGARCGNFMKHKSLTSWRQVVPPLFIATIVALGIFSVVSSRIFPFLGLILGTYFGIAVIISVMVSVRRSRVVLIPLLACAFVTMHFGWALGFWRRVLIPEKMGTYWGG